jgi:penicillin-binding protein 1A
VLAQAKPHKAGEAAERVIDPRNAFIMHSIMRDVVRMGTAARAMKLGRTDLAGKTGTTNDFIDAWFCGFNPTLVAIAWIGFDQPQTLGRGETGGLAALPIWMGYIASALKGVAEQPFTPPPGVISARVSPESGSRADGEGGIPEFFYQEFPPPEGGGPGIAMPGGGERPAEEVRNQLF